MDDHSSPDGRRSRVPFADRHEAGIELADTLAQYQGVDDLVVLALPRGGVPVAFEVARILDAPLDVFVVRKLGMPGDPEFAIGAIASGGVRILREDVIRSHQIPGAAIEAVIQRELAELARRELDYREGRPMTPLRGRTVVLVDDGLATGSSMRAAVEAVRVYEPAPVIVAVPVGAPATCEELAAVTDRTICARMPESFSAVGQWYRDFSQTTDAEVRTLLAQHAARRQAGKPPR
jgi:predicted phosphoribosyltransferase